MSYLKYCRSVENQSKHCSYKTFCSSIFNRRIVPFHHMNCAMKMGGSWRHLLFLFLINLVGLTIAQPQPQPQPQPNLPNFLGNFCDYTSNSIYQTNLNTLLSTLSNNTDKYGFHSASYGENPDRAHAIVLCRGDANLDICRSCINNATSKLLQVCPNSKQAIGWYDYCMLRYSNTSMEGIMAGDPRIFVWSTQNVTSVAPFVQALTTLLGKLQVQAASGGKLRKFATGNTSDPNSESIYALAQCTPDISEQDCKDCLQGAIDNIPLCCNGRKGGRVIRPSCHFRYEMGSFYNEIPADAPPAVSPSPSSLPQASPPPPPSSLTQASPLPSSPGNKITTSRIAAIFVVVSILSTFC